MQRTIRNQLLCMLGVLVGMLGLGVWAQDFIIDGIMAKPALNVPIFVLFFGAAFLAINTVWKLKNETLAMQALQVDYAPNRREKLLDPYATTGVVFQEPTLLGHAYRMITEELTKSGRLQIPTTTVQTIISAIDHRISEKKSLIAYFGNLLVFLGLLGAFIGLMRTVGSVGDLIGGMDLSGNAGSGAFAALIEGMKAPLNGMSVGFSSSLFGLATSLVLGAYERFMQTAMKALRNEFEAWLTNVSQLEGTGTEEDASANVRDRGQLRALRKLARLDTAMNQAQAMAISTNEAVKDMSVAMKSLAAAIETQNDQRGDHMADLVAQVAVSQRDLMLQVSGMVSALAQERQQTRVALVKVAEAHEKLTLSSLSQGQVMWPGSRPEAPAAAVEELGFEAAFPAEPESGARGLFQRLARTFQVDQRALAQHHRQTHAIVRDLYAATHRTHQVVQSVIGHLATRAEKEALATTELAGQQEQLIATLETFAQRMEAVQQSAATAQSEVNDQLAADIRSSRFGLEVALKRLELQLQEQQAIADEALAASAEAITVAQATKAAPAATSEARRAAGGE
jgi:hypothetical protein